MAKITIDELNAAYEKANKFKIDGSPTKLDLIIDLDRNPLTHADYFDEDEEFVTPIKLKFKVDTNLGPKGAYVLVSNVEILDDEN